MKSPTSLETGDIIRARLSNRTGRLFWRSLDEVAQTPEFTAFLEAEFPSLAPSSSDIDRRSMLKIMAASFALAGLAGCDQPDEKALPYVNQPEFLIPGKPKWYATAVSLAGFAQPVLGKTHVGRPVKLEGNPDHPATRGASDVFMQAALLDLYDPDRSQAPRLEGEIATWSAFDAAMASRAKELDAERGEGFCLLTGTVTSPTFARQIADMLRRWPKARWHVHEPIDYTFRQEATRLLFGRPLDQHIHLDRAEAIVCLDDDILGPGPHQARNSKLWSERRAKYRSGDNDCRLFAAEPAPSLTGTRADRRLIVPVSRIGALTCAIAAEVGVYSGIVPTLADTEKNWVFEAVSLIDARRGRSLVSVGMQHTAEIQALVLLINERVGNIGKTVSFTEPIAVSPSESARSFKTLVEHMEAGHVTALAAIGVNPAYTAPGDLNYPAAAEKVQFRLHAGCHYDETAMRSHWHVPLQHELESWSDARAIDGTVSIIQPLVRPFYSARSPHVLLDGLMGGQISDHDLVQATWKAKWAEVFPDRWQDALYRGFVPDSAEPSVEPALIERHISIEEDAPAGTLSIVFRPDPTIWDGRFSRNAWLQETPKPLTKITWGNAILISPAFAAQRHIENGDELAIETEGRRITGAAWILPGQEANTLVLSFGYGRGKAAGIAEGLGCNAFDLQRAGAPWRLDNPTIKLTGERQSVATTQLHQAMEGFDFVQTVDHPDGAIPNKQEPSFYPEHKWKSPSWGMSIDLDACTGCNACVVACMAENNVPVVGKDLVKQGREMHWLRIDHYYEGDAEDPKSYFQPVPCMHCEDAPCEMGCPVNATVHSSDGLNLQIYNRCIGTRTCSSFCPYKVRRFNWFDYTSDDPVSIKAMHNPDVTVRERGVMEKCTYCVQRISEARIAADMEGRPIGDGEVVTACQQACPTQAIIFGDVIDPKTQVSRSKTSGRSYSLLEEVNTKPRTTYLARIEPPENDGEGGGK